MRYLILIFLVLVLPAGVYWAVNGMASPEDTWERFAGQVDDIRRSQPDDPEPEPEPEPKKEKKEEEPEEKPDVPDPVKKDPEPVAPRADPVELFAKGKFAAAVDAYGDAAGRGRALARLGVAMTEAFPEPTGFYLIVDLRGGSTQEGFIIADGAEIKLMDPTGRAISIPSSLVRGRQAYPPEKAEERVYPRIQKEVASGDVRRLFRATSAAFRMGRPDWAAPLLEKVVQADSSAVLKAIATDVPALARDPLFRAYTDAVVTRDVRPDPVTVVRNDPKKTNGTSKRDNPLKLNGGKKSPGRNSKFTVTDSKAKEYMVQARPLRLEGKRLYDKIYGEGLDNANVADVEQSIRKYEAALALYEKALEREDDDTIYVLVTGCSKKLFQLRFWKEQLGGR